MSDNSDDDMDMDESFDDFEKKDGTLGDLWRDNPLFKIGAIAGGALLVFIVIFQLGGGEEPVANSVVGSAPDITSIPATEGASPSYIEAIKEQNEADIEKAFSEGGSSLPVPIEPPVGIVNLADTRTDAEDPLQRWKRLQEERLEREANRRTDIAAEDNDNDIDVNRAEAIQNLADAMSQQMSSILQSKADVALQSRTLTDPSFLEELEENNDESTQNGGVFDDNNGGVSIVETLLPAGEIVYAQLLTEANSDVPGPVLAQLQSGPLKGHRVLGSFEVQSNFLTLNFDTVIIDGQSLSVDAVALDPGTTLPGLATEVNHRYFRRVILPAAAAFVEGVADAVAESGRTTVTIEGDAVAEETEDADTEQEVATGVSELGEELGEILDDIADETEVLVRIESGTPLGILFLEPVTTDPDPDLSNINEDN